MEKQENGQSGWICPRCGKVNAPWVKSCDCKSIIEKTEESYSTITSFPTFIPYPEKWDYTVTYSNFCDA